MLNAVKNLLTRRQIIGSGIGILGVGMTGIITHNSPAIAQPAFKPAKEPPLPDEKKLGWAVVGLGKFATQQIIPSFSQYKQSKLAALVSGDRNKAESYARQYTDYYRHQLTVKQEKVQEERQIQEQNQFALEMDHLSESVMQNKQPKTPGEEG